ncbi:MAG: hypothetical protein M1825_005758 [Sarcosagium campestre]|nr:MAG: hypothetical protein M1825_005758 [Sarcosagium campestre]
MEAAMKLSRQYFLELKPAQPERTNFMARKESYHGTTLGALSMSGHVARRKLFEPMLHENVHRVSACNAYHGMHAGEIAAEYVTRLAQELDDKFQQLGPETVCAFVAEPIVGAALGCVPSIPGYFRAMKAVCDKHGALLIFDEVMCGMGRTGTLHAWEQEGVVPDVQTIGKGLGGGYAPIAGVLINHRVVDTLTQGSGSFSHGQTYQGHPVACAAAAEVQRIISKDDLLANIELVKDRASKTPFDPTDGVAMAIHDMGMLPEHGISIYPGTGSVDGIVGDHVMLAPPYTVTPDEIRRIVDLTVMVIERVLHDK